jgi:amidophosphoribosyltransferase
MLFDGLTVLQHRGQDAAGIVTAERRRLHLRKDNGLVKDVFHQHHMLELRGNLGVGHVRYPTAGSSSCAEAQPLYTNYPYGICVAHNGNLTNTVELAKVVGDQIVSFTPKQNVIVDTHVIDFSRVVRIVAFA